MPAFATGDDLVVLNPGLDAALAALAVELASDGIRGEVLWQVDQHEGQVTVNVVDPCGWVTAAFLPAMNVTSVTVVADGRALVLDTDFTFEPYGVVNLKCRAYEKVVVDYTAGYLAPTDPVPPVFRVVTLERASALAANPTLLKSYKVGEVWETFGGSPLGDPDDVDPRLAKYQVGQGFA